MRPLSNFQSWRRRNIMHGFAKPVFAWDPLKHNVKAAAAPFFNFCKYKRCTFVSESSNKKAIALLLVVVRSGKNLLN